MVADKESAALGGNIVPALDPDAVNRPREHPEHEAQERVGQEDNHVNRPRERRSRGDQKDRVRAQPPDHGHQIIEAGRGEHADEGQQIRSGQNGALAPAFRAMLQQGGDRDDEESAEKPQHRQIDCDRLERQSAPAQERAEQRQAHRPERDQAVFDFVA